MRRLLITVVALSLPVSPIAGQPERLPQPTGEWLVSSSGEQCAAIHEVSSDGQRLLVGLVPEPAGDEARLQVVPITSRESLDEARISTGGSRQKAASVRRSV